MSSCQRLLTLNEVLPGAAGFVRGLYASVAVFVSAQSSRTLRRAHVLIILATIIHTARAVRTIFISAVSLCSKGTVSAQIAELSFAAVFVLTFLNGFVITAADTGIIAGRCV